MGQGIEAARFLAPEHAALMEDLKEQLLIVFLKRLGGKLAVPVTEVDATGGYALSLRVDAKERMFHFELQRKT